MKDLPSLLFLLAVLCGAIGMIEVFATYGPQWMQLLGRSILEDEDDG